MQCCFRTMSVKQVGYTCLYRWTDVRIPQYDAICTGTCCAGKEKQEGREREGEREKDRARETQRHNPCQGAEGFASIRVAIAFSFNSFSLQTNAPQSTCLLNLVLSPSYLSVTTDCTSPFRSVHSNTDIDCNMSGTACGPTPLSKS